MIYWYIERESETMTKSELFTQYNRARAAARKGLLDPKRVNKALGLAQSKTVRPYLTTTRSCSCPDAARHLGQPCKHRIAAMIEYRATHATQPQTPPEPEPESPLMNSNGDWLTAEQRPGSYTIHVFCYPSDFTDYQKQHPGMQFTRPSQATGRRQRPDEVHPIGESK
jgi:hypothetical protein